MVHQRGTLDVTHRNRRVHPAGDLWQRHPPSGHSGCGSVAPYVHTPCHPSAATSRMDEGTSGTIADDGMKTPDYLTQAEYRAKGFHVIKVEQWGLHPEPHRVDFLGIYDYLAFDDADTAIFAIQTTTKHNMNARRKKMLSDKSFAWWTRGHRRSLLHGWECVNKARGIWVLHEVELTMDDWNKFQDAKKEMESHINTESPLYKELFPNGHDVNSPLAAECVPI